MGLVQPRRRHFCGRWNGYGQQPGSRFWYWIHDQRRVVVIVWNAGWVDTLLLSADAMRLDGANLNGAKVSAVRRVPPVQAQTVYVPEEPPPPPPQQPPHGHHGDHGGPPQQEYKRQVEAGPIWSNEDAQAKCPSVCQPPERWNGQWWTTQQGVMSVCECVSGGAPIAVQPSYQPAPPAPAPVYAMDEGRFQGLLQRLKNAAFANAKLNGLRDEVASGGHWTCQQLIVILKDLTFGDTQVQGASILWPNVVDPQNFPAVAESLTFEGDRQKLRRALGR